MNKELTKDQITMASKTLKNLSGNVENASNKLHKLTKNVTSTLQSFNVSNESTKKLQKTNDSIGIVNNIAKFFNNGQEKKFYQDAIPFILEQSGFDEQSTVHKIVTSEIAGKAAPFLKPVALSILSYYVRKNIDKIPENNPFQVEQYPSLLDNDSSSNSDNNSLDRKVSTDDRYQSCITDSLGCIGSIETDCDKLTSRITEPIEDTCVQMSNSTIQKYTMTNDEYSNLRNVLKNGGLKKLYIEIFPNQSKQSKIDLEDLKSESEVEKFVKKHFKDEKDVILTHRIDHDSDNKRGCCIIQ